jgi:hypothetical protein
MQCYVGGFYKKASKKFKFGINRMKNSDTLCEDVRKFMTAVDINRHYSAFLGCYLHCALLRIKTRTLNISHSLISRRI